MIKKYGNLSEWEVRLTTSNKKWYTQILPSIKGIMWFVPEVLVIKESCSLIRREVKLTTTNKRGSLSHYLPLMVISMQKIENINWFFQDILVIKESCNLIGREAQLATPTKQMTTPNQKWKSQLLTSLGDYLRAKNLRYQLILSSHFDDQRILHSY